MWIVLWCHVWTCDIAEARQAQWRLESLSPAGAAETWAHPTEGDPAFALATAEFRTQQDCLASLRRTVPEHHETWSHPPATPLSTGQWRALVVNHRRDYVEREDGGGTIPGAGVDERVFYACFLPDTES